MRWRRLPRSARDADQPRQHRCTRSRRVDAVLRERVRDGADSDADLRVAGAVAARRRHAAPPLPLRRPGAGAASPRDHDRRLRRRLRRGQGARLRVVWLSARRASVAAGAALFPRSGRKPDRAELARCRPARPLALSGTAQDRGVLPAEERAPGGSRPLPVRRRMTEAALRRRETVRRRRRLTTAQVRALRIAGWVLLAVLAVLPVLWVCFFA